MPDHSENNSTTSELFSSTTTNLIASIDGIPLPPVIKKNIFKSIGRLITGLVDVPVALLEAKAQQIKSEADALSLITKRASEAAASEFGKDEFLINRTINHFGSKLLREQINRENTVQKALDELKLNPPEEDSKDEIDSDWLESFSKIAESKSNEEVQLVLSKILAGEIRNPGAFSLKTLHTLSLLDQNTAKIFQSFCDISFEIALEDTDGFSFVISDPCGSPGNNGLKELNLSYVQLTQLQDAGLIQHNLTAWREIPPLAFNFPIGLGSKILKFNFIEILEEGPIKNISSQRKTNKVRVGSLNFTSAGLELRKVMVMSFNPIYIDKFIDWVKDKFKIEIDNT
jgi:hypothetical protein